MNIFRLQLWILFGLCVAFDGYAREPYHALVVVGTQSASVSAPNLVDLNRDLRGSNIQALVNNYTPTSAVAIDFNLRGIFALTAFAANSTELFVSIPQAGTIETFDGGSRDASLTLFKDFLRDGGRKHRLLRAYARHSPIDPIAGNPTSLMSLMAQADYVLGKLSPLAGCDCSWSAQPVVHQFQVGTYGCRAFPDGYDTSLVTLPLRYSYSPAKTWAIILDMPFTYIRNGGASSVVGSLGSGFRLPITERWSMTGLTRLGFGGSLDLCTSGSFISTGLNSDYDYKVGNFVASLTNYVGYYSSINLWLSGVNYNYHLHNYIFKNGVSLTSCKGIIIANRPVNFSAFFVDSYFARDRLFIRHYDEVGVSLITTGINPCLDYDCASLAFSYQFGQKDYKAYTLNIIYQF